MRPPGPFAGLLTFLSLFVIFAFQFSVSAQEQDDLPEVAPPPLKLMSKDEKNRLDSKTDLKDRTKLSLELMDLRMDTAERFATSREYDLMFRELGGFQALLDDGLNFLGRRDVGSGKVLDNFKRFEIGLRAFSPRIETIRRELPLRYDDYVRKLMKYVRDARAKATDSLFGETVVPTQKP